MFSAFPSLVFHTKLTVSELKSKQVFHLTVTELGLPVSDSSTRSQNFMPSTISERKLHKTGIDNWPPIGFNLGLS